MIAPFFQHGRATLYHADHLDVLREFAPNSIDADVTDGPYGIRFMGKAWDGADIERSSKRRARKKLSRYQKEICGRATPPPNLAMSAGEYNLSLNSNRAFQEWTEVWAREIFRVLKPGAHLASFGSTRTYHRMASGIEDAGFEIRDQMGWMFGSGFPKSHNLRGEDEGNGTALKPGWEPICLARKPLEHGLTVKQNFEKWGTGCLNIDGCRIPGAKGSGNWEGKEKDGVPGELYDGGWKPQAGEQDEAGRWPANVTHDGSDDVLAVFPAQAGAFAPVRGSEPSEKHGSQIYRQIDRTVENAFHGDSGSAARFFYCGKATVADREAGLEYHKLSSLAYGNQAQAEVKRGNNGHTGKSGMNTVKQRANIHPTVKPTALMRWLVRLVTPKDGTCLDHMAGSGSTGKAALLEGMTFIGIEKEEIYMPLCKGRVVDALGELFAR